MTAVSPSARPPRPPRTLVQKLAPIVLGFESIVVFLAGLTVFGLKSPVSYTHLTLPTTPYV